MTPSITEEAMFQAIWDLLTAILPPGVDIVQFDENKVATPSGPDYVVMTPLLRERLSTNVDTWPFKVDASAVTAVAAMKITLQLDIHGPNSADNAQVAASLWRDRYAFDFLKPSGVAPLYAGEPAQRPFINGAGQYERRWTVDAVLQANIAIAVPQDFANVLTPTVEPV